MLHKPLQLFLALDSANAGVHQVEDLDDEAYEASLAEEHEHLEQAGRALDRAVANAESQHDFDEVSIELRVGYSPLQPSHEFGVFVDQLDCNLLRHSARIFYAVHEVSPQAMGVHQFVQAPEGFNFIVALIVEEKRCNAVQTLSVANLPVAIGIRQKQVEKFMITILDIFGLPSVVVTEVAGRSFDVFFYLNLSVFVAKSGVEVLAIAVPVSQKVFALGAD